jgi:Phage integrase, N-terminal SAM-like domain
VMEGGDWDRVRIWEVERCWGSMTTIPDHLSAFIRFIQLKFLRKRTEEEYVRWVTRLARQGGVACRSLLGQEEVLAFLHDLQQNHDHEGSTLNQAVCALMYRTINDLSLYPIKVSLGNWE